MDGVSVALRVGVRVDDGDDVSDAVLLREAVDERDAVGVRVGVTELVRVRVGVRDSDRTRVDDGDGDEEADIDGEFDGEPDDVGDRDSELDDVSELEGVTAAVRVLVRVMDCDGELRA